MENAFGILASIFVVLLGKMQQRLKVVTDIVLTYVVLHNMLRTHKGGQYRALTPADDIAAITYDPAVYVPDENHRNFLLYCIVKGIPQGRQRISETY